MYDGRTRALALAAIAAGESLNSISKRLGTSRATLRDWRDRPGRADDPTACPRCTNGKLERGPYAQLLGLFLGDGCLSSQAKGVYALRITCDVVYPRLVEEAAAAVRAVHPTRPVHRTEAPGCVVLTSYWKHWPCLFPQHGPGPKHLRRIELADWQQQVVADFPESFLRGLFDADGCRVTKLPRRNALSVARRQAVARLDEFVGPKS